MRLTNRSSRDRFAARLTRYLVPQRRAATQSGLTQVLAAMTTNDRPCPICNQLLPVVGSGAVNHFITSHPLLNTPHEDVIESCMFYLEYQDHLLRVFEGAEPLDEKYSRYIVRTVQDNLRYAAQRNPKFEGLILNTPVSEPRTPNSDHTWATKKNRK